MTGRLQVIIERELPPICLQLYCNRPNLELLSLVNRAFFQQIIGEHVPLATGAVLVEDRVEHFTHVHFAGKSSNGGRREEGGEA